MIIGVLLSVPAMAHEDFEIAEQLMKDKVACDQLTDEQLEGIGDFIMEQMHPGELHEQMDAMMGGEGSESLTQMHIAMAKRLYCHEANATYGMMGNNSMIGGMMGAMMGGQGMMAGQQGGKTMMGYGSYGMSYGYGIGWGLLNLIYLALAAFVVGIIFWWTKKLVLAEHKGRNH